MTPPPPPAAASAAASYSPAAAPRARLTAAGGVAAPSLPPLALTAIDDRQQHSAVAIGDSAPVKHPIRLSMHAHSRSEVEMAGEGEGPDVTHAAAAAAAMTIQRARKNSVDMEQAQCIHAGSRSGQSSPSILSSSPVNSSSAMLLRTDESKLLSPLGSQAGSLKTSGVPTHPAQIPRAQSTTLHGSSKSIGGSIDALDWFRDAPQQPPPHAHARSLSRRSLGGSNDFSVGASLLPSLISAVPAVASNSKTLVPRKSLTSSQDLESQSSNSSSNGAGPEQNSTPIIHNNSSRARIGHTRTMSRTQPPSPKLSPRATPTLLQSALALDDDGKLSSPQKEHGASIHLRSFNNSRASSPACSMPASLPPISGSHSSCSSPAALSRRMSPAVGELQAAIVASAATPRLSFGSSNTSNARLRKPLALSVYDFSPAGEIPSGGSGSASSACASPVPSSASKATMSPTGLSGTPLFYTNRSPQQLSAATAAASNPSSAASSAAATPSALAKVTRAFSGVRASLQGSMSGPVSSNGSLNSSPNVTPKLGSRTLARLDRPSSMTEAGVGAAAASAPNSGTSSASSTASPSPAMFGGGGGRITGGAQASLFGGSPSSMSRRISPLKVNPGAAPVNFQSSTSTSPVSSHPVSPTKTQSFAAAMTAGRGNMLSAPLGDRVAIGGGGGSTRTSLSPLAIPVGSLSQQHAASSPLARSPTASPLSSSQQTPEQQRTVPASPAESVPSSPMHLSSLTALSKPTMPSGLPPTPPPPSDAAARASPPPTAAAAPQPFAVLASDRPSPSRLRFLPPPISLPVLTAGGGNEGEQHEMTPSDAESPDSARSLRDEDIEAAMAKVARKAQQAAEDEARFAAAAAEAAAEADEIDTQQSPSPICSPVDEDSSSSSVSLPFELPPVFVQASRSGAALESPSPSPRRKPSADGQPTSTLMRRVRSDDEECERALLREVQAATLAASQAASPIGPANPVVLSTFENGTASADSASVTFVLPDAPRASFHNYARSSLDEAALSSPGSSPSGALAQLPQPPKSPPHSRPASAQGLVIQLTRPDSMNARRLHSSPHDDPEDRERDRGSASADAPNDLSPFQRPRANSFGGDYDDAVAEEDGECVEDDAADFWDAMDSGAARLF